MRHLAAMRAGVDAGVLNALRFPIAPTSLWEEVFERHQREREELLRWEDKNNPSASLKRTASSETIKEVYHQPSDTGGDSAVETTDSESGGLSHRNAHNGPSTTPQAISSEVSSESGLSDLSTSEDDSDVESLSSSSRASEAGSEWEILENQSSL